MRLSRDFHELLECFAHNDVRYLIAGGWALAAHGHPRMTNDLDDWIWPQTTNAHAVISALEEFGFEKLKANKRASGRPQDTVDVEILEGLTDDLR